jgi:hypothetical protein
MTRLNGSASALPTGTVELECAGSVRVTGSEPFAPLQATWVDGIALPMFERFGNGAQAAELDLQRGDGTTDADTANLGDEILLNLPEVPNHNKRIGDDGTVGARAMQLTQITELADRRRARLLDSGPNAQALATKPTHSIAASADTGNTIAEVTITNAAALNALGYGVRIQMAVGAAPGLGDFTDVATYKENSIPTGAIRLRPVVAGSKVSVRARSQKQGSRPSDWSAAVNVTLAPLAPVTALAAASVAGDGSLEDLSWTAAAITRAVLVDVFVRPSASAFTEARLVATLSDTSTRYRLEGLTPNTQYKATVRYRDWITQDVSANVEVTFTTANSTYALGAPYGEVGFSGIPHTNGLVGQQSMFQRDWQYGLAVYAAEFPSLVAFYEAVETAIGSGAYGAFALVGRIGSVSGAPTVWTGYAPNDGKRRQIKARHEADGRTSSSYSGVITISPWTPTALTPIAIPQASLQVRPDGFIEIRYDGPAWVQSVKWFWSTSAMPSDATTLAGGTAQDGRTATVVTGGGIALGATVYATIIPFSGLGATGVAGPSIHLIGSYQDFTATKTIYFGPNGFVPIAYQYGDIAHYVEFTNGYIKSVNMNAGGSPATIQLRDNFQVPNGVTITGIAVDLYTDNVSAIATCTLFRSDSTGGNTSIASVNSNTHNGWETKTASPSESTTNRRYQMLLELSSSIAGANIDARCAGFYITYTMPSVAVGL